MNNLNAAFPHATEPYLSKFLANVMLDEPHWLWTGHVTDSGYGLFTIHGQTVTAHRVAYEWAFGPVHSWLDVDHKDRTPLCVFPDHLEAVTHLENVRRGKLGEALRGNPNPLASYLCDKAVSIEAFARSVSATPRTISLMLRSRRPQDPELVYRVGDAIGLTWEETDKAFPRRARREA